MRRGAGIRQRRNLERAFFSVRCMHFAGPASRHCIRTLTYASPLQGEELGRGQPLHLSEDATRCVAEPEYGRGGILSARFSAFAVCTSLVQPRGTVLGPSPTPLPYRERNWAGASPCT